MNYCDFSNTLGDLWEQFCTLIFVYFSSAFTFQILKQDDLKRRNFRPTDQIFERIIEWVILVEKFFPNGTFVVDFLSINLKTIERIFIDQCISERIQLPSAFMLYMAIYDSRTQYLRAAKLRIRMMKVWDEKFSELRCTWNEQSYYWVHRHSCWFKTKWDRKNILRISFNQNWLLSILKHWHRIYI